MKAQVKLKVSPEVKKARTAANKTRRILKAAKQVAKKAAKWPKTPRGWTRFIRRHSELTTEV